MTCLRRVLFTAAAVTALTLTQANASDLPKLGTALSKCTSGEEIEKTGTVAGGVDGDTVHLTTTSGTYSIRFLGIDTPETHYLGKSQGVWGEKAARALQGLLPVGTKVKLEFGDEPCDAHGRVLAQVFKGAKGNFHVNAEMLKTGLAVNYCVGPEDRYCADFSVYVQDSIDNRTGMFADPKIELPYNWRRRVDGRGLTSFVGNIHTKVVVAPERQEEVPIADRVFFFRKSDVKAPYHF